ncbi:hypothetical protein B566_EDAN007275 [Ephemera danica]|nr:hypothetical protein B566_EDAN007275 [Ephemera danica]
MQRKYSMMRWGVATGTVIFGITIIITGVIFFTAGQENLGPTEVRSLTIALGTTSLLVVVLMIAAYIAIEIMRKRELDRVLQRQELTYRAVQRDIEIVVRILGRQRHLPLFVARLEPRPHPRT